MEIKENKYVIYDKPKKMGIKTAIMYCGTKALGFYYKCLLKMLSLRKKDYDRQYTVAICAIFKNEAKYLKEWIEFHRIVGVEHFYLYNNNSEDEFFNVLQPYIDEGVVEVKMWEKNQAQIEAYADCMEQHNKEAKWIGFIDIDEFVVPIEENTIYDYLKQYNKTRGSVLLYWQFFGTSGKISRKETRLVTDSFHVCWHKHDGVGKCFYNTNFDFDATDKKNGFFHHILWTQHKHHKLPPFNIYDNPVLFDFHYGRKKRAPIQINHYFTKSYEEYLSKKSKGDVYFKINPHDEEYFYKHEMKCCSTDYSIEKYMIKLKLVMGINE